MSLPSTILLIAGSPSESSRSAALLDSISLLLALRGELKVDRRGAAAGPVGSSVDGQGTFAQVERARAIVVATPVYKAAYSGVLKVFLDLLPQTALAGKRHEAVAQVFTPDLFHCTKSNRAVKNRLGHRAGCSIAVHRWASQCWRGFCGS